MGTGANMGVYSVLGHYHTALRRVFLLETVYPALPELSALWTFMPAGRPERMSHEGRYVLFIYRMACEQRDQLREWLLARGAEAWEAAVAAEARYVWQMERGTMAEPIERWAPAIAEFMPMTSLAVA